MKAAIIAPKGLHQFIPATGYHLVLAHQMLEDSDLAARYYTLSAEGAYVILDNSAHEFNNGMHAEDLETAARLCGADEIVLPDRLFFGGDTVQRSTEAFVKLQHLDVKWMAVPQGRTFDEWRTCLKGLLPLTTTIGISKDYEVWPGGLQELVIQATEAGALEIHLLGWGRQWSQVSKLTRTERIRGIDSSKPVSYARQRVCLPPYQSIRDGIAPFNYPGRGDEGDDFDDEQIAILKWNIEQFRQLVGDPTLRPLPTK